MTERERFDNILRETGRRGIENVLFELDKLGFYSAPATERCPLLAIIKAADGLAAHILEAL